MTSPPNTWTNNTLGRRATTCSAYDALFHLVSRDFVGLSRHFAGNLGWRRLLRDPRSGGDHSDLPAAARLHRHDRQHGDSVITQNIETLQAGHTAYDNSTSTPSRWWDVNVVVT